MMLIEKKERFPLSSWEGEEPYLLSQRSTAPVAQPGGSKAQGRGFLTGNELGAWAMALPWGFSITYISNLRPFCGHAIWHLWRRPPGGMLVSLRSWLWKKSVIHVCGAFSCSMGTSGRKFLSQPSELAEDSNLLGKYPKLLIQWSPTEMWGGADRGGLESSVLCWFAVSWWKARR